MNKQELLNKYEKEEDRLLISYVLDKLEFTQKRNSVESTSFLDMHQKSIVENMLKSINYKNYILYGGYEDAERVVAILYPEKLETVFKENHFDYNSVMKIIRIILPNEMRGKYTHRDYLGAVIKVGMKREVVGDILVSLDGADIIVEEKSVKYLQTALAELTRFHKSKISVEKIDSLNIMPPKIEKISIIIPSMRMDSIVSEIVRTSRSKANELIQAERVFINNEVFTKNSKLLKENDMITVRGKGRFKISKILNNTKKGNLVLEVEKYI